eukprot:TRINITY_DN9521_c0_g1_i1.p1 TRINITY_DN9521_c0_g1~~TRINITY_DN9521_c0_g1_i1.p1  ORF type:complete len:1227 (+),score=344.13 TRINITY_DN9521_c0_g1_i1:75-3755(+)
MLHCGAEAPACLDQPTHHPQHATVVCGAARNVFCVECCCGLLCDGGVLGVHKRMLAASLADILGAPTVFPEICRRGADKSVIRAIVDLAVKCGGEGDGLGRCAGRLAEACVAGDPAVAEAALPRLMAPLCNALMSSPWDHSHGLLAVLCSVLDRSPVAPEMLVGIFPAVLQHLADGLEYPCPTVRCGLLQLWVAVLRAPPPEAAANITTSTGLWPRVLEVLLDAGAAGGPLTDHSITLLGQAAQHPLSAAPLLPLPEQLAAAASKAVVVRARRTQAAAADCLHALFALSDGAERPFLTAMAGSELGDHLLEALGGADAELRSQLCALLQSLYSDPRCEITACYPLEVLTDCASESLTAGASCGAAASLAAAAACMDRIAHQQQGGQRGAAVGAAQARRLATVLTTALLPAGSCGREAEEASQLRENGGAAHGPAAGLLSAALDAGAALLMCRQATVEDAPALVELAAAAAAAALPSDGAPDPALLAHLVALLDSAAACSGAGPALAAAVWRAATGGGALYGGALHAACSAFDQLALGDPGAAAALCSLSASLLQQPAGGGDAAALAAHMLQDGALRCALDAIAMLQQHAQGSDKHPRQLVGLLVARAPGGAAGSGDAAADEAGAELWLAEAAALPGGAQAVVALLSEPCSSEAMALRQALCIDCLELAVRNASPLRPLCTLDAALNAFAAVAKDLWRGGEAAGLALHLQSRRPLLRRVLCRLAQGLAVLDGDYGLRSVAAAESVLRAAQRCALWDASGGTTTPEVLRWVAAVGAASPIALGVLRAAAQSCGDGNSPHVAALAGACATQPQLPATLIDDAARGPPEQWRCPAFGLAARVLRSASCCFGAGDEGSLAGRTQQEPVWGEIAEQMLQGVCAALRRAVGALPKADGGQWPLPAVRAAAALCSLGAALLSCGEACTGRGCADALSGRVGFVAAFALQTTMASIIPLRRCVAAGGTAGELWEVHSAAAAAAAEAAAVALDRAPADGDAAAPLLTCSPGTGPCCGAALYAALAAGGDVITDHIRRRCPALRQWALRALLAALRAPRGGDGSGCPTVWAAGAARAGASCGARDGPLLLQAVAEAARVKRLRLAGPGCESLLLRLAADCWERGGADARRAAADSIAGTAAALYGECPRMLGEPLLQRVAADACCRARSEPQGAPTAAALALLEPLLRLPRPPAWLLAEAERHRELWEAAAASNDAGLCAPAAAVLDVLREPLDPAH